VVETVQETSRDGQSPDVIKNELLEKAEKLKQKMEERHFELTGKKNELDVNGLYRDMLRKMMLNVRLISQETFEALREEYQKRGAIEPLLKIAGEGKDEKLKNIPEEATEFEDTAIFLIKHYCEKEHVALKIFFEQLAGFIGARAIEKERQKIGTEMQKDMGEYEGIDKKSPDERKGATHEKIKASRLNRYIIQTERLEKDGLYKIKSAKNVLNDFKEFVGDPRISKDLRSIEEKYRKLYVDAGDIGALQTPEGTIRQAEILGLHY
jgi:hypothetical protein